jgi:hypothetical protein
MKVNIYETVEVTDEQRVQLGALLDSQLKPKRQATRDELKEFIWTHGVDWDQELTNRYSDEFHESNTEPTPEPDEDLIGGGDEPDEEDLI